MTNEEARRVYLSRIREIAGLDAHWKAQGLPLIERARRAWRIRYAARVETRRLMTGIHAVEALRRRDIERYRNPDGPNFPQLVDKHLRMGKDEDGALQAIIESSSRSDTATGSKMGLM